MARESDAGARLKSGRGGALLDASRLDPTRSTMRRLANRRIGPRSSVPSRDAVTPRVSDTSRARDLPTPRNRRVPRANKGQGQGPGWHERVGRQLLAACTAGLAFVTTHALQLQARVSSTAKQASEVQARVPRLMQVLAIGLVLVGAWGLARFVQRQLTTAPAFAIDAIDVQGLVRVERGELLSAAGLQLGLNVFARSPEEVRAHLLRHPWILSAKVERELPSRIQIAIVERQPVAHLVVEACSAGSAKNEDDPGCEEASSLYLVSADAKLFKRLSGRGPVDLPVITGVTRQRFASDPDLQRRILAEAIALMHDYKKSGLWQRNPIGEIHLEANDGYSLYVGEDLTYVRLGQKPFDQKLLRMKKVFERLARERARAEYIYLDNEQRPDRVAVRLR